MKINLEFVRGNQRSFIKLSLEDGALNEYEYQMCIHNAIKSFLPFQKRNQNGEEFIYYDMSGMQSLDILLQTQKLKRERMILLAKALLKLCHNVREYMLSIESVVLEPKFIMYQATTEEIQFVYAFQDCGDAGEGLTGLLEYCIDYLDYGDKLLMDCVFRMYENLQDQGANFSLEKDLEILIDSLSENASANRVTNRITIEHLLSDKNVEDELDYIRYEQSGSLTEENTHKTVETTEMPNADFNKYNEYSKYKRWKRWSLLLLGLDALGGFLWKPMTLLKLFFFLSFGIFLLGLYFYIRYLEKRQQEQREAQENNSYIQEYESLVSHSTEPEDGTQFISIESISAVLYNLEGIQPQYIYITETPQLIGKDASKVQICILADGISRVHARVMKSDKECVVEDLCSTNGTWVNGENIGPRVPYILKEGDRVRFAGVEYIFR